MIWLQRLLLAGLLALLAGGLAAQALAPIPALDSPVIDITGTLDAATRAELEQQALDLQTRKGSQLQVLMVTSTQPEDITQYAQRAFDQWKLGRKGVDDGVLLIVAKDDRRVRIHPGYGLEGVIPDATASRLIQEYMVPRFRAGDFAGGVVDASAVLVGLIDGEMLPAPVSDHSTSEFKSESFIGAMLAAYIVAVLVSTLLRRRNAGLRGLAAAAASSAAATAMGAASLLIGLAGILGLFVGLSQTGASRRYVRDNGWGGMDSGSSSGGWGGASSGGSSSSQSSGGWSGGGGRSGGGGASGSW